MEKFIYRMEVSKVIYPKKMNWLGEITESFDDDEFPVERYELYFSTFEEMSEEIDKITEGFHQYWANVYDDLFGNSVENLEYHNGRGEWDTEIDIVVSRLYLIESLLKAIEVNNK